MKLLEGGVSISFLPPPDTHTEGCPLSVSMPCASGSFPAENGSIWEVEKNISAHLAHTELPRPLWRAVVQTNVYLFVQPVAIMTC